ncbi:MAG: efflux RND transporter periplasmic adaptor subunit [Bacteroidaceae bacterium]|nr:efflux RND transporter periplasmic adaptor subunit [Bacteroidaceae bacterium]
MDIKLPKKPWYVRYRIYLLGGTVLAALIAYAIALQLQPKTLRVSIDADQMATVCDSDFLEYVDVNGLVCPVTSMRVSASEGGVVERICCQNGDLLRRGDTILVLSNPKVLEEIASERRNYEHNQMQHRKQLIEMQQKSITLRQQALAADFELRKMAKNFELEQEETRMGVKSQAQLEVAREEYDYNRQRTLLTIESLRHDSVLNIVGRQLIEQEMSMEAQKLESSLGRRAALVVLAPVEGQISGLGAVVGGQVSTGELVGEIGVLTDYKVTARLNEYYIDRIQSGQSATAYYKGQRLALQVSRITPQVQDHAFAVELTGNLRPSAGSLLRPGLTLRLKIELGQSERRLIVPRGNFYAETGGQWVMLVDKSGHRARRVPIRLGRQNAEHYEVLDGLRAGDRVIVSGYDRFGDAQIVEW